MRQEFVRREFRRGRVIDVPRKFCRDELFRHDIDSFLHPLGAGGGRPDEGYDFRLTRHRKGTATRVFRQAIPHPSPLPKGEGANRIGGHAARPNYSLDRLPAKTQPIGSVSRFLA